MLLNTEAEKQLQLWFINHLSKLSNKIVTSASQVRQLADFILHRMPVK